MSSEKCSERKLSLRSVFELEFAIYSWTKDFISEALSVFVCEMGLKIESPARRYPEGHNPLVLYSLNECQLE